MPNAATGSHSIIRRMSLERPRARESIAVSEDKDAELALRRHIDEVEELIERGYISEAREGFSKLRRNIIEAEDNLGIRDDIFSRIASRYYALGAKLYP